ncbi:MAG: H-X9-DG-CTERM domain-containing protein, partial [Candidatus Dormibacteraceae bacterium]
LQVFVADHNAYPSMIGSTNDGNWFWAMQIQGEGFGHPKPIKEFLFSGVWRCPSAPKTIAWVPDLKERFCSYAYNALGGIQAWSKATNNLGLDALPVNLPSVRAVGFPPVREPGVAVPSDMMAIGDSIDGRVVLWRWLSEWAGGPSGSARRQYGRASDRHQGSVNVLFCDGHVESPTVRFVFEDSSDAALARWNRDHQPHREFLLR